VQRDALRGGNETFAIHVQADVRARWRLCAIWQQVEEETTVIGKGFVVENPISHSRVTVLEGEAETGGRGWLLENRRPPHTGTDVPEHLHLTWTETFEILSGTGTYKLNHELKTAAAGDVIVMPPRLPHIHPWNTGERELIYRQRTEYGSPDPHAMEDVLGALATRAELAREGKCDEHGRPRNPLQLAVSLKLLNKHGGYDASIPILVQDLLGNTLGTLGKMMGYRAVYQKFLE
jgi:mannose-6-phosphate isomerase-like protein (cupin superfamily)